MRVLWQITIYFCLMALSGCSLHPQVTKPGPFEPDKKVAQNVQSRGVMSADDYQHCDTLRDQLVHAKPLDDGDIDWCIGMLHKPSQHPDQVQSLIMGLFFDDRNMTLSQKTKVRGEVMPFLSSQSQLARSSAQLAMKRLR